MSASLDVRLVKPLNIQELLRSAEAALRELLAQPSGPALRAEELDAGIARPPSTETLDRDGQLVIIKPEDSDDEVCLVVTETPAHPLAREGEAGLWADVSAWATRSPLEYALVAGIALALARIQGTAVVDEGRFWSSKPEQTPDAFADAIRLTASHDDIRSAAQAMYASLPVGLTGEPG